jgi:hypothetical protein
MRAPQKTPSAKHYLFLIAAGWVCTVVLGSPAFAVCSTQGLRLIKGALGSWQGEGTVMPPGTRPQGMSCNVNYKREGISGVGQTIACAGTDYRIDASNRISCEGNTVKGTFKELNAQIEGTLHGLISGNRVSIEFDAPGFKGHFNLAIKGREETVEITLRGFFGVDQEVPVASMQLSRAKSSR